MTTYKSYQASQTLSRGLDWGKLELFYSFIPSLFWLVFYFPLKIIFNLFFHLKIESKEDLRKLQGSLVIASSHASWIDPFLIGIAFPFGARVFPIHYATLWKYYYFPLFTPLIWLFGGFPIRKGIGLDKTLAIPVKILKLGGVVGIFPSGKRTRKWNESEMPRAKRGVVFLSLKSRSPILPVKIEGSIGMKFSQFLLGKYKIKIKIGKKFYLPLENLERLEKLNSSADYVMHKIVSL